MKEHTPGDPMPCSANDLVDVQFAEGDSEDRFRYGVTASSLDWGKDVAEDSQIIEWRFSSETPRVDRAVVIHHGSEHVLADFARSLEMEINELGGMLDFQSQAINASTENK